MLDWHHPLQFCLQWPLALPVFGSITAWSAAEGGGTPSGISCSLDPRSNELAFSALGRSQLWWVVSVGGRRQGLACVLRAGSRRRFQSDCARRDPAGTRSNSWSIFMGDGAFLLSSTERSPAVAALTVAKAMDAGDRTRPTIQEC